MTKSLQSLRIGYSPYSPDLTGPGDRRRFVRYAKERGLSYENLWQSSHLDSSYDLVVLSSLCDLTRWRKVGPKTKVIFELIDSYLDINPTDLHARLRGAAKYLLKQHDELEWSYHRSLERICARADVVVCSTPEQRERILPFNSNVHPVLDFHDGDVTARKQNYDLGPRINLVWEGLAGNLFTVGSIAPVLREIAQTFPLKLHLITDLRFKPINGPSPRLSTDRLAQRYFGDLPFALYQWDQATFSPIAAACDIAIIPMAMNQAIHHSKAENKLLLFWRVGVPTLTSATPAYKRSMHAAGVDMCCDESEWKSKLLQTIRDASFRAEAAQRGRDYADDVHGPAANLKRWDDVFASIGLSAGERQLS